MKSILVLTWSNKTQCGIQHKNDKSMLLFSFEVIKKYRLLTFHVFQYWRNTVYFLQITFKFGDGFSDTCYMNMI